MTLGPTPDINDARDEMSKRDEIRQPALVIGQGLTQYIEIHDKIFQNAATFKSVVKNLFGRGVPMSRLLQESERLVPMWAAINEQLELFRRTPYSVLTPEERSYCELLLSYASALTVTVRALVDRQRLLNEGSVGGQNNPMTWELFREKERVYESAVAEYQMIGRDLNAAAPLVFD